MKTKWLKQISTATCLCLVAATTMMLTARAADKKNASNPAAVSPAKQPTPAAPESEDSGWKDPGVILTNIAWDGLPLSEIARILRDMCRGGFDVLFPNTSRYQPAAYAVTDPTTGLPMRLTPEAVDAVSIPVSLQLRNVTVTEVFRAMNLVFDTENAPWRWDLMMNGSRPTALLRILPERLPLVSATPELKRMVFFVGDLLGDPKSGGMTEKQLTEALFAVWHDAVNPPGPDKFKKLLQFHPPAQLLLVTGTPDEVQLIESTLSALRQKVELDSKKSVQAASQKSAATKTP